MAPSGGPRDTAVCRRAQREGATWIGSVAKWLLEPVTSKSCIAVLLYCGSIAVVLLYCCWSKVPFGGWGWGLGPVGGFPLQTYRLAITLCPISRRKARSQIERSRSTDPRNRSPTEIYRWKKSSLKKSQLWDFRLRDCETPD